MAHQLTILYCKKADRFPLKAGTAAFFQIKFFEQLGRIGGNGIKPPVALAGPGVISRDEAAYVQLRAAFTDNTLPLTTRDAPVIDYGNHI